MTTLTPSGNCNLAYLSGLGGFKHDDMIPALKDALTEPTSGRKDHWTGQTNPPAYRYSSAGIWLFAQGSEDSIKDKPYATAFANLIEELNLGQVIRLPGVPNELHSGRKGYHFVWILNKSAMRSWWETNVLAVFNEEQKKAAEQAAVNAAKAIKQQVV